MHKLTRDESQQRVREVEILGKRIARLEVGTQSVATSEFNSIITEDASTGTIQKKRPKRSETKPNETDNVDSEEEAVDYNDPRYNAKTCL